MNIKSMIYRLLVRSVRVDGNGNLSSNKLNVRNDILDIEMKYLVSFSLIGLFIGFVVVRKIISVRKEKKQINAEGGEE